MDKPIFVEKYIGEVKEYCNALDFNSVESLVDELALLRENKGRLFILGMGGSAANASHAATDLRKLCSIEAYAPVDNVSEITANVNDFGIEFIFTKSLQASNMNSRDSLFVFSVGGGDEIRKISTGLIHSVRYAKTLGSKVYSIVGREDSYVAKNSNLSIILQIKNSERVTPHSETLQSMIWHLLSCHPKLQISGTTW